MRFCTSSGDMYWERTCCDLVEEDDDEEVAAAVAVAVAVIG